MQVFTPIGPEVLVNADTAGPQFGPTITTLKNGDFVVAWTSYGQDRSQNGVFGRQYSPNAMPRGSEFQINTCLLYTSDAADD